MCEITRTSSPTYSIAKVRADPRARTRTSARQIQRQDSHPSGLPVFQTPDTPLHLHSDSDLHRDLSKRCKAGAPVRLTVCTRKGPRVAGCITAHASCSTVGRIAPGHGPAFGLPY